MDMHRLPISVVILTYNEELNIANCLCSVSGWVGEVFVVDSGSADRTLAIAEQHSAVVTQHPFETHTRQWSWALTNLPLTHEWVLGLDADQRVTSELRTELIALFSTGHERLKGIDGLYIKRRYIFRGRWIRHGAFYPKYLLKLFRRDKVHLDELDLVDHHFFVHGNVARLHHDIIEENHKERNIAFWIEKHNRYALLHAREELLRKRASAIWAVPPDPLGSPDQTVIWLKQRWYHLPLYLRPILYFVYRYIIRLGFLDGKQGFIFNVLQVFWYRLLVDIHLDELQQTEK